MKNLMKFINLAVLLFPIMIFAQNTPSIVSEVRVEGIKATSTNDVLRVIDLRPGDTVTPELLNITLKNLHGMQRFKSVSLNQQNSSDGVILIFQVEEEALIDKIQFEGVSAIKAGKLRKEINLQPGVAFREALVRNAIFKLKQYYEGEGNLEAEVTYRLEPIAQLPGQFDLVFEIQEGPKLVVIDIVFTGNENFKNNKLEKVMKTKKKLWIIRSGVLKEEEFLQDKESIIAFYQSEGYMDVAVNDFSWKLETVDKRNRQGEITKSTRGIVVYVDITEGEQYKVGTFDFEGNNIFIKDELNDLLKLKDDDVYNKAEIEKARTEMYKLYADRGYLFANISVLEEKTSDNVINTSFVITEGKRAHIERINIRGNTKTLPSVVRRYLQIEEGEIYVNRQLEQSFNRLMQTQFFSDVRIEPSPGSADGLVNVDFVVTEAETGSIELLLGYGTVSGFSAGVKLSEKNLFGRGYQISLRAEWGEFRQLGEITFTDPAVFNSPFSLSFIAGVYNNIYTDIPTDNDNNGVIDGTDFNYRDRPTDLLNNFFSDFQYERLSFRLGLAAGVQFAVYWNINVGYDLNIFRDWKQNFSTPLIYDGAWRVDTDLINSFPFGWTVQSAIYTTIRFNNTDGGLWPTTGINTALFASFSGGIVGGDLNFINLTYNFDYYWSPFKKWYNMSIAFHYDMAFLLPQIGGQFNFRDANLLNFDGVYKMRGWFNYLNRGQAQSYFSIETRFPIWEFVGAVAFWDYGAIFPDFRDFNFNQSQYIMSFGAGIAINLPVLPIRLYGARPVEWQGGSFKLANSPKFEEGWEFVFSIQGLF